LFFWAIFKAFTSAEYALKIVLGVNQGKNFNFHTHGSLKSFVNVQNDF
jgi:hypothetical protein